MLSLFLSIVASVAAECTDVASVPEAIQVAWVSPVREQARTERNDRSCSSTRFATMDRY